MFSLSKQRKYVPSGSVLFSLQSSKCCLPGSWPKVLSLEPGLLSILAQAHPTFSQRSRPAYLRICLKMPRAPAEELRGAAAAACSHGHSGTSRSGTLPGCHGAARRGCGHSKTEVTPAIVPNAPRTPLPRFYITRKDRDWHTSSKHLYSLSPT